MGKSDAGTSRAFHLRPRRPPPARQSRARWRERVIEVYLAGVEPRGRIWSNPYRKALTRAAARVMQRAELLAAQWDLDQSGAVRTAASIGLDDLREEDKEGLGPRRRVGTRVRPRYGARVRSPAKVTRFQTAKSPTKEKQVRDHRRPGGDKRPGARVVGSLVPAAHALVRADEPPADQPRLDSLATMELDMRWRPSSTSKRSPMKQAVEMDGRSGTSRSWSDRSWARRSRPRKERRDVRRTLGSAPGPSYPVRRAHRCAALGVQRGEGVLD